MRARRVCAITRLEKLLDKVNPSPWPIQLIPQNLIGGACGCAKTAVHALAQNGVGGDAIGGVFDPVCELGVHGLCLQNR